MGRCAAPMQENRSCFSGGRNDGEQQCVSPHLHWDLEQLLLSLRASARRAGQEEGVQCLMTIHVSEHPAASRLS